MNFNEAIETLEQNPLKLVAQSSCVGMDQGMIWCEGQLVWWPQVEETPFPVRPTDKMLEDSWEIKEISSMKEENAFLS